MGVELGYCCFGAGVCLKFGHTSSGFEHGFDLSKRNSKFPSDLASFLEQRKQDHCQDGGIICPCSRLRESRAQGRDRNAFMQLDVRDNSAYCTCQEAVPS